VQNAARDAQRECSSAHHIRSPLTIIFRPPAYAFAFISALSPIIDFHFGCHRCWLFSMPAAHDTAFSPLLFIIFVRPTSVRFSPILITLYYYFEPLRHIAIETFISPLRLSLTLSVFRDYFHYAATPFRHFQLIFFFRYFIFISLFIFWPAPLSLLMPLHFHFAIFISLLIIFFAFRYYLPLELTFSSSSFSFISHFPRRCHAIEDISPPFSAYFADGWRMAAFTTP
jgi:hypothetical protein